MSATSVEVQPVDLLWLVSRTWHNTEAVHLNDTGDSPSVRFQQRRRSGPNSPRMTEVTSMTGVMARAYSRQPTDEEMERYDVSIYVVGALGGVWQSVDNDTNLSAF